MKKKLKIIILIVILLLAGLAIYLKITAPGQILDGPGSYIEMISGEITDITDISEYEYTVTILVDEECSDLCYSEYCMAVIEKEYDSVEDGILEKGDHIRISYPGGVTFTGDPMFIKGTYGAEKI